MNKYLDEINSAIQLSSELFEFSRLYERIGSEQLVKVDVGESFGVAVSLFPNLKSIKFSNNCDGLEVEADSSLSQLFYNLIDNSLKHGGKVTQIKLWYIKEADQAKLFFEDDGVGISDANKPDF